MVRTLVFLLAATAMAGAGAAAALFATPDRITVVARDAAAERRAPPPPAPDRTDEVLAEITRLRDALVTFGASLDSARKTSDAMAGKLVAAVRDGAAADRSLRQRLEQALGDAHAWRRRIEDELEALAARADGTGARPAEPSEPDPPSVAAAGTPSGAPHTPARGPGSKPVVRRETADGGDRIGEKPAPVIARPGKPKRASLAALLARHPVVDVRDRSTRWVFVPGHCRVGFDGSSTIHNFTARSDAASGAVRLHFRNPSGDATGRIRLSVASLASGNADRDHEIRHHLGGDSDHPEIVCEILGLAGDPAPRADRYRATALVRFTIGGKTKETKAPVTLAFTKRRLLHVTGEAKLRMSDFGIHPKAKLGVVKVEDTVTAWWDLHAEADRGKD